MITEHKWFSNWYATRLHAVPAQVSDQAREVCRSECGEWVYKEPQTPWAARSLARGVPRCKKCLKKTGLNAS